MSKAAPDKAAAGPDDYQAHSDLHTLIEHAKIHRDPKRKKAAMAKHAEMLAALQQVAANAQQQPPQGAPAGPAGPGVPTANGGAF